jgi:hypothetical protein
MSFNENKTIIGSVAGGHHSRIINLVDAATNFEDLGRGKRYDTSFLDQFKRGRKKGHSLCSNI